MSDSATTQGPGAVGFKTSYWKKYYGEPQIMDCVYNAKEHAHYLQHLFALETVNIGTMIDFGYGLGHLLEEMINVFMPYQVEGIEPSAHTYALLDAAQLQRVPSMEVSLFPIDLLTWCLDESRDDVVFDLGICTSVFQYLSDEEINLCVPIMAKRVKYLYFTIPIDTELDYQANEMNFDDVFAIPRSREAYHELLSPGFTIVSTRVLESKIHFDEENTCFNELMFRF